MLCPLLVAIALQNGCSRERDGAPEAGRAGPPATSSTATTTGAAAGAGASPSSPAALQADPATTGAAAATATGTPATAAPTAPREPGSARPETTEQIQREEGEAKALTRSLLAGGIAPREVAAVADMRGHRLYRERYFRRALGWFAAASAIDPSFEPPLFHAARCAAALGDLPAARRHLASLGRLGTPLARSKLRDARRDPDLAALHLDARPADTTNPDR